MPAPDPTPGAPSWSLADGLAATLPFMVLGVRRAEVLGTEKRYRLRSAAYPGRRWVLLALEVAR